MTQNIRTQLISESTRAIRQLIDFKPSHKVPKEINIATQRFVKSCVAGDIAAEMELVWNRCREGFGYKRKDKVGPTIEAGSGILVLPHFRYCISVDQDSQDPKMVFWRQSVDEIKDTAVILSPEFNAVFARNFDTFESDFFSPQKIEDLIDRIENLDSHRITVKYPADCTYCDIVLKDLGISIHVNPNSYRISLPNCPEPKALLEKTIAFQNAIHAESSDEKEWPFAVSES